MDDLRWLLLIAGIIVIVGVYVSGRWRRDDSGEDTDGDSSTGERLAPILDNDDEIADDVVELSDDIEFEPMYVEDDSAAPAEPAEPEPQKIVTLRVVARDRGFFKGDDLILSMRGIGLRHGKFGIFHRVDGDDDDATIFSAASLVEPGSFDLANIRDQQTPGISLFLVLPGPVEGAKAFDMMMEAARMIAQSLHGELLDESGSTLSIQRERYMREEIIQFEHSVRVA
ncbi:MAG: cell division protein ZipA [Pseudomonadota bacterium]